jgi:glycosyltransferase involved in cell wall biosynthesis
VPHRSPSARSLRIVHVSPAYAPLVGGAERLLQSVSERLVQRGHDVTVLTFDCATLRDLSFAQSAGLPKHETLNGVRVIRVDPVEGRVNRLLHWWLRQPGGWRSTAWLFRDEELWPFSRPSGIGLVLPLWRLEADVVTSVNWYFGSSYWACPPRRVRRVPRVAIPVLHIAREWANNPLYPRMLRDSDATIVCTDAERDFVQARGGTEIAVAGAGVDPIRFERRDGRRIRACHGMGDRPVVGFVGRQDTLKGVPTLIDAMHIVWRHSPDAMLLMAGQRAHREADVTRKLDELSPADRARVVLVDDFSDADGPSIMDACDVLALPSVEEAFGMVMIEAWMCGKPVIGADIASTRCIIEPGVDGFTSRPFDSVDLAEKILELLVDPAKRAAFGERGRAKVLSRYTWEHVTDVWETTLQRAARRGPSSPHSPKFSVG